MRRYSIPLFLLALWCALTWLPLHGIDDEPLVITKSAGVWSSAGVSDNGLSFSISSESTEIHSGRLTQEPPPQTPLAVERIWILGLQNSRLLRSVGVKMARELTAVPGVQEVAWFPRASQPLTVKRTPDLWIVLDMTHEDVLHFPGYCKVTASLQARVGRDPLLTRISGPWRNGFNTHSHIEFRSDSHGIKSAGARYQFAAQAITQRLDLHGLLQAAAQDRGRTPSPPLDRTEPVFPIPSIWAEAVGETGRLVQAGRPPGMAGEALWHVGPQPAAFLQRLGLLGFTEHRPGAVSPALVFFKGRETVTLLTGDSDQNDRGLLLWRRALNPKDFATWLSTSPAHERVGDRLSRANLWPGSATGKVLAESVRTGIFPGAVALMGSSRGVAKSLTLGKLGIGMPEQPTVETLYDLASLTKVLGTTTLALILEEEGLLRLEDPVSRYLPGFIDGTAEDSLRRNIQLDHLLTHTSGLPPWRPLYSQASNYQELLDLVLAEPLEAAAGERRKYSDLGLILLGAALEACTGTPLAELEKRRIFEPLGLSGATRNPSPQAPGGIAPTEARPEGGFYHGVVHDENSRASGGQTAHAGLFAAGIDLAAFCREWLWVARGGQRILPSSALERCQQGAHGQFLGWQKTEASYPGLGKRTLYHTGFTGTALWIDPDQDLFLILLTNRVHPSREGTGIGATRRAFVEAALADRSQG